MCVLPRVFPEHLPGPGGYASSGCRGRKAGVPDRLLEADGRFPRVAFNCALCHSTQYRASAGGEADGGAAGGSHTADIQALLDFFSKAANDPRFNADTILGEVDPPTRSLRRPLLYKLVLIPMCARTDRQGERVRVDRVATALGTGSRCTDELDEVQLPWTDAGHSIDHTDSPRSGI